MLSQSQITKKLTSVLDPELGISIVDLGLIYKVKLKPKGKVEIIMTLTTIGCPLFDQIAAEIKSKLKEIKAVKEGDIELVFDPPWSSERMSEEAKIQLGFV